jgi:diguanylate cyclase (GGDEF)-like protein
MNFTTLPNLTALAILVVVFWAISRKASGEQVYLWLAGWILVLVHFGAEVLAGQWPLGVVAATISLDALLLASVAFLISVVAVIVDRRRQVQLAVSVALPALGYANALIWGVSSPTCYYLLVAIGAIAPLVAFWRHHVSGPLYTTGVFAGTALSATLMIWLVAHDEVVLGLTLIFASLNFATAVLYWSHRKRGTAGVLTTVGGFFLWGAVFPTANLLQRLAPAVKVESEVWNIPKYLVAVGMILTLLEDQIERSTFLAYHDELTDLPNRRLLEDRLDQALAQADRAAGKLAVLVLDLDHFKEVNDRFGHRVGDMALREVVARLASRIRASDTLARSGGDEFTVVSHVATREAASVLVSALESALAEPILVDGKHVQTGLSIGLALYPEDGSDPDELRAAADRAMYVAKRAARIAESLGLAPQAIL